MNVILTTFAALTLVSFWLFVGFCLYKLAKISRTIRDFTVPPDDKTPSALGQFIANLSDTIGQRLAVHVQTSVAGVMSTLSRRQAGVEKAVLDDVTQEANPLLASVLNMFPSLKKSVKKNPAMLGQLVGMLPGLQGKPADNNGQNSQSGPDDYTGDYK